MMSSPLIEIAGLTKSYEVEGRAVHALQGIDLTVPGGQFLALIGRSGCGKSTLLNLLGGLDTPTGGRLCVAGKEVSKLDENGLTFYRRETVGIVFQFFNLMPTLTALENVMLPGLLAGKARAQLQRRAEVLLETVGLGGRTHHRPDELSGGEMQRVAVARALLSEPAVLLADEPTGNLDSRTGTEVLRMLREATRERGLTVVMVTHDPKAAAVGDRIVRLADGRIVGDERVVHEQAA